MRFKLYGEANRVIYDKYSSARYTIKQQVFTTTKPLIRYEEVPVKVYVYNKIHSHVRIIEALISVTSNTMRNTTREFRL